MLEEGEWAAIVRSRIKNPAFHRDRKAGHSTDTTRPAGVLAFLEEVHHIFGKPLNLDRTTERTSHHDGLAFAAGNRDAKDLVAIETMESGFVHDSG
ncbi:MAG: hypothetical protein A2X67_03390 [Ignavibacteria bacterium GWA2_55_11]|nr:MAG: hypothetical protein A2X67_03390 [Ignavibacteria bacterium GWA2_55_11]OGU46590.1 MAG: hypothetical protein A2X68_03300 [Ignavibacteria bacterium GWC2_56_12]OGU75629.1 MAG: hypothetical protein A3H45_11705 [Ignavibacteria bacterium RIFCSPLOWO2_02_FULL_55_14]OGU76659.1 MAG: hypothetical protein A3G43_03600 [Ignavibacteria bacterium RIFCSPLOWO2_12_FULL_56_21]HAV22002.1 hypothetical protein [Bacteroidota bacterium]